MASLLFKIFGMTLLAAASQVALAQPLPQPSPRSAAPQEESEPDEALPDRMVAPPKKPDAAAGGDGVKGKVDAQEKASDTERDQDVTRPSASGRLVPPEEMACRAALTKMGATFTPVEPEAEDEGCGTPFPLSLQTLGGGIDLDPDAVVNCQTALATVGFVRDHVVPAARAQLKSEVTSISHASAYVCRDRRDGSKLSEHARANAIDLSAFVLADERRIDVKAYGPGQDGERAFMRRLRSSACGPFKTVLGPGSDGDHADHLHLDLAERRAGSTYCR